MSINKHISNLYFRCVVYKVLIKSRAYISEYRLFLFLALVG